MTKKLPPEPEGPIQKWGAKVDWQKRVRAVCKPCWEIKYCPYGPLVEFSPMKEHEDDRSCRIFGHDCPVFYCSEPLTETKELRNISRTIPRPVQFRVLKRENQICSDCGNAVRDEDIEFDHIIPWSKGGSSDESNVRLLCGHCNRKRGNRFEDKYLINSLNERLREPIPFKFIEVIFEVTKIVVLFRKENGRMPNPQEYCNLFGKRKPVESDTWSVNLFNDIDSFLSSQRPKEFKALEFSALKYRWEFIDGIFHKLKESAKHNKIDVHRLLDLDIEFVERLGFYVTLTNNIRERWLRK